MHLERDRNNRNGNGNRLRTLDVKYSAQIFGFGSKGVFERKAQPNDIPKIWAGKDSVHMRRILMSWLLCRHDRQEYRGYKEIHIKSVKAR